MDNTSSTRIEKVEPYNPQSSYYDSSIRLDENIKEFSIDDLPDSFFGLVVAPRRSGKSEKMASLLERIKKNKNKRFDHIFLFSQTNAGYEHQIPQTYRFRNLEHLPYIINKQAEVRAYNKKQTDPKKRVKSRILILLDDMIGEAKGNDSLKNSGMIRKLSVNGRHLGNDGIPGNGVSVFIISQAVKEIPKTIRMNTDIILSGRITSRIERQTIIEEFTTLQSDREGMKRAYGLFDNITLSNPYRFIVVQNHIANKRKESDFIFYYDGEYPVNQTKMFGDRYDWEAEEKRVDIF